MFDALFTTAGNDWAALALRLTLGLILFPHGAQKLLGWFGGYGYKGTMGFFTRTVGLPSFVGLSVILLEFFGSALLVLGLGTRIWAFGMFGLMIGIVRTAHVPNGFFMNWNGTQKGEGYEYHLLAMGIALALVVTGGGAFSLDALFLR